MKHTGKQYGIASALLMLCTTAQAALVSVGNIDDIYVANMLLGSSNSAECETVQDSANCDFLTPPAPGTFLDNAALEAVVTSNPASYVLSPFRNSAYMDLGFDGYDIYNGEGDDLVVFIVGNNTSFGLDVYDNGGNVVSSNTYIVPADGSSTVYDNDGNWLCVGSSDAQCTGGAALSAIFIDLEQSLAGDIAIGNIRLSIGENYNGPDGTRPRFSLAGGFHTIPTTEVPLPLPALLFLSGLSVLGFFARRRPS